MSTIPDKLRKGDIWRAGVFRKINGIIDYLHSSKLIPDNDTISAFRTPAGQVLRANFPPLPARTPLYEYDGNFEFKIIAQDLNYKKIATRRAYLYVESYQLNITLDGNSLSVAPLTPKPELFGLPELQTEVHWEEYIYIKTILTNEGGKWNFSTENTTLEAGKTVPPSTDDTYYLLIAFVEKGGNIIYIERGIPTIAISGAGNDPLSSSSSASSESSESSASSGSSGSSGSSASSGSSGSSASSGSSGSFGSGSTSSLFSFSSQASLPPDQPDQPILPTSSSSSSSDSSGSSGSSGSSDSSDSSDSSSSSGSSGSSDSSDSSGSSDPGSEEEIELEISPGTEITFKIEYVEFDKETNTTVRSDSATAVCNIDSYGTADVTTSQAGQVVDATSHIVSGTGSLDFYVFYDLGNIGNTYIMNVLTETKANSSSATVTLQRQVTIVNDEEFRKYTSKLTILEVRKTN